MGLDATHNCWHGPYSAFMRWRQAIAAAVGIPLDMMDGFVDLRSHGSTLALTRAAVEKCGIGDLTKGELDRFLANLPIKWEVLRPSPLHILLSHSDCDGEIRWQDCGPIALALADVLPDLAEVWHDRTQQFITGLREAAAARENVEFG